MQLQQVRMPVTLLSDAVTIMYTSGISQDTTCILKLNALVEFVLSLMYIAFAF